MKKQILLAGLVIGMGFVAQAKDSQRVILSDSKTFTTQVSVETVRCSMLGYGTGLLKINLSGLDGWTLFDHSNAAVGEFGEPCMAAGRCELGDDKAVNDLIGNKPGSETITVLRQVLEIKRESKDEQGNDVCIRSLQENLNTTVRGTAFKHSRTGADQTFAIEVCRK
jgi:hypothetical protein